MLPEIKKILYATDLSENARYAFGYAVSLAKRYQAKITVMHVLEELSPTALLIVGDIVGEKRWSSLKKERVESVIDEIRRRLETFCDDYTQEITDCPVMVERTVVTTGHPVELILKTSSQENFDLIVMGSHGQGMLAEVMMGSTSRRVLRRCKKPVLVVRLPEERSPA